MEISKKLRVSPVNEADDCPEDRLQDVLMAVKAQLKEVKAQNALIDEENAAVRQRILEARAHRASLVSQGAELTTQIAQAKQESQDLLAEKAETNRQVRQSNQEAIFFQGQAELLKTSLKRDIQLLRDREQRQKSVGRKELDVFKRSHEINNKKIEALAKQLQGKETEIGALHAALACVNARDQYKLLQVANMSLPSGEPSSVQLTDISAEAKQTLPE